MELAYDLQRISEECRFALDRLETLADEIATDPLSRARIHTVTDHIRQAGRIADRLTNEAARQAAA